MAKKPAPKPSIRSVRSTHDAKLMSIDGVVGVGEGERNGKVTIKVYVAKKTKELAAKLPREIAGFPLEIEESGELNAL